MSVSLDFSPFRKIPKLNETLIFVSLHKSGLLVERNDWRLWAEMKGGRVDGWMGGDGSQLLVHGETRFDSHVENLFYGVNII